MDASKLPTGPVMVIVRRCGCCGREFTGGSAWPLVLSDGTIAASCSRCIIYGWAVFMPGGRRLLATSIVHAHLAADARLGKATREDWRPVKRSPLPAEERNPSEPARAGRIGELRRIARRSGHLRNRWGVWRRTWRAALGFVLVMACIATGAALTIDHEGH